jgi:glucuronokinase
MQVYIVTNAEKFKPFERWASAHAFPRHNIINDGTTSRTGNIGALADLLLAIRAKKVPNNR